MKIPTARLRLLLPLAFCGLLVSAVVTNPQGDWNNVVIKGSKVAGNVHFLLGRGGNLGVLAGKDGVLLVDTQFAPLSEKIEAGIKKISKEPLRFVVNTHWHGDHTGGNAHFGGQASLLAHANVRKRLAMDESVEGRKSEEMPPAAALPVLTYEEAISLHMNGEEVLIMHFPKAHTDGDSVVYFTGSGVLHMGDLYFAGRFPFIDLDSGGSLDGLMKAISSILVSVPPDTRVIPGHGPVTGIEELRAYQGMLGDCKKRVEEALAAGRTVQEMKDGNLLAGYEEWGTGFIKTDRFLDTLVKELSE